MPREFPRSRRVEEQIQRILGEVMRSQVRDPRLAGAIVTSVKVSRDLGVAWIYMTSLDPDHTEQDLAEGFSRASGFLRTAVAAGLTVRHAPELRFRYDDTSQRAADMEALIDAAVASDQHANEPPGDQDNRDND